MTWVLMENLPNVFYEKTWQSNNFFPVNKVERTDVDHFTISVKKGGEYRPSVSYSTTDLLYRYQHNLKLLSDKEMKNDTKFNYE